MLFFYLLQTQVNLAICDHAPFNTYQYQHAAILTAGAEHAQTGNDEDDHAQDNQDDRKAVGHSTELESIKLHLVQGRDDLRVVNDLGIDLQNDPDYQKSDTQTLKKKLVHCYAILEFLLKICARYQV